MARFSKKAAQLLDTPIAQQPGFAARAASCYLIGIHASVPGFNPVAVWPGYLDHFDTKLSSEESFEMAIAILEVAAERGLKAA